MLLGISTVNPLVSDLSEGGVRPGCPLVSDLSEGGVRPGCPLVSDSSEGVLGLAARCRQYGHHGPVVMSYCSRLGDSF